jgi:predicted component of type VI protein secretion system
MNAPTDAEGNDQAMAFDILQHHIKALDKLLHNMADIDDMVDELTAAAKKAGDNDRDATAHRQARAYKLTQIVLTAAMQQYQLIEEQMAAFLASAPKLAKRLAQWQADD